MGRKNYGATVPINGTDERKGTGAGGTSPTTSPSIERDDSGELTRGTADDRGSAEKEKLSTMVILTEEEKKEERNRKRRERYAKQKAENGGTVRPRKVNKKNSKEIDRTYINSMVEGVTSAIASRPNCSHWKMSSEEIDSITKPLCGMLKDSDVMEKLNENADSIALVAACFTVFAPRIATTVIIEKEKKKNEKSKRKDKKPNPADDKRIAADRTDTGKDVPFYGESLY